MIMDGLLLFDGSVSSAGVLSGTSVVSGTTFIVGSTDSANIIDVSQLANSASGYGRDVGIGDGLQILCMVGTAFTSGGGATMAVSISTAPDSGSGTPGTWGVLETGPAVAVASLTAGTELLRVPMPLGVQKFLKLTYTVATANMTAGTIISAIVLDRQALGTLYGYRSGFSNTYL
jgi:hypothetical protein